MINEGKILSKWMSDNDMNANKLATKLKCTRANIYYHEKQEKISDEFKKRLEVYGINIFNKPSKPLSKNDQQGTLRVAEPTASLFKPIPFYDINVSAGNVVFLDNGLLRGARPDDYMYIPIQIDADVAFPTYGSSMYPEISNGDRVAYKYIEDWTFFNYGMKYLIITDEQRMVKYIKKHTDPSFLLLTSRNKEYEPIDMPVKSIRRILQVRYIGKIEM